jgi:hypothetical protein
MKKAYYFFLFFALLLAYFWSATHLFVGNVNNGAQIRDLERMDQSQLRLQMNLSDLLPLREYAIIGGGTLNIPADFTRVAVERAAVVIVHGTDYKEIRDYLTKELNSNSGKTFILSSLALKRVLMEKSDPFFSSYLERYKKSGDIFNNQGAPFYYMDQIDFSVKENLAGIVISFPVGYYFSNVKNYGLAHLIQNDFSIQGFENPIRFLEAINFPKPAKFSGSFEDLIRLARKEYHEKYLANIVSVDYKNGLVVSRDLLPFIQPRKQDKVLPLFKVLKLSKNVFFSGLLRDEVKR